MRSSRCAATRSLPNRRSGCRSTAGRRRGRSSTASTRGGARRRKAVDQGFVLSDQADWPGLNRAIEATQAERVYVTHGFIAPLVQWLNERGVDAHAMQTEFEGEAGAEEAGA